MARQSRLVQRARDTHDLNQATRQSPLASNMPTDVLVRLIEFLGTPQAWPVSADAIAGAVLRRCGVRKGLSVSRSKLRRRARALSSLPSVVVKVVERSLQHDGNIDFKQRLPKRISFFDVAQVHSLDSLFGGHE